MNDNTEPTPKAVEKALAVLAAAGYRRPRKPLRPSERRLKADATFEFVGTTRIANGDDEPPALEAS